MSEGIKAVPAELYGWKLDPSDAPLATMRDEYNVRRVWIDHDGDLQFEWQEDSGGMMRACDFAQGFIHRDLITELYRRFDANGAANV